MITLTYKVILPVSWQSVIIVGMQIPTYDSKSYISSGRYTNSITTLTQMSKVVRMRERLDYRLSLMLSGY